MALRAGMIATRRTFADPSQPEREQSSQTRQALYAERLAYASSSVFDDLSAWRARLETYGLYTQSRAIYNPTGRLVEFFASQVYPGYVPQGDLPVPKGARVAIPFVEGTDPRLIAAALQVMQWSNWQIQKDVMVELGASVGECLVEIVDDVERGKVAWRVWWPGLVTHLDRDWYGNITAYTLEYDAWDADARERYRFKQVVTKETIGTYRDGKPWRQDWADTPEDSRLPAEYPNPYGARPGDGFVPAVWVQHRNAGTSIGEPALRRTAALDELNSVASRAHDYVRKRFKAPTGVASKLDPTSFGDIEAGGDDTSDLFAIWFPEGASAFSLAGDISPAEAIPFMEKLMTEIEADNPELAAWNKIREMGQVSGVAVERMLGDTQGRLYRAQASYDSATVRLVQMSVAIAGMRLASGAWGAGVSTKAREKFRPFGLGSFAAGNLDLAIAPRELVPPSEEEIYAAKTAKYTALQAAVTAGLPEELAMVDLGWTEDEAAGVMLEKAAAIERRRMAETADVIPTEAP